MEDIFSAPFVFFGGIDCEDVDTISQSVSMLVKQGLHVVVCTSKSQQEFERGFPALVRLPIWVLYGEFNEKLVTQSNVQFGVQLGSANQYLVYYGEM